MSIDKKAFGITEVHTPTDLDESMISRYATQVVLGSKLKEMLDGDNTEPNVEATTGLDTLTLAEEPTTEDTIVEDTTTEEPVIEEPVIEEPVIEEPVIEEPVIEEPVTDNVIGDAQPNDQENTKPVDQEEITVDEETV